MKTKQQINETATLHKLKEEDSERFRKIFVNLKTEIEWIIKRDNLPIDVWYPSEDFKFLVRKS